MSNLPCPRLHRLLAAASLAGLVLAGCGGDGDGDGDGDGAAAGDPEAQPAPGVTTFQEGDFEGVPLPGRHTPVSERVEEDGVVSQSFEVRNTPPEELLDYYEDVLSEYEVVEPPGALGVGTHRGRWLFAGRELTVVAQTAETLEDNPGAPEVISQLSLSLAPE